MTTFRQMYLLSLLTVLSTTVVAAELKLAYRGIQIGDSLESVRKAMAEKFSYVEATSSVEPFVLSGSDQTLHAKMECSFPMLTENATECALAKFVFWPTENGQRLTRITVDHQFSTAVPASEVIEKMTGAFGTPRRTYHGDEVTWESSANRDDTVLLWGGRQVPSRYRPTSSPDYLLIGGEYIAAVVYQRRDNAAGYLLMIIDADQDLKMRDQSEKRKQAAASEQELKIRKKNIDSIRF